MHNHNILDKFNNFMMKLKQNILKLNNIIDNHNKIHIWPATFYSIQYLTYIECEKINKIVLIDNSPIKFNKYLYSIPVKSLIQYIHSDDNKYPLILFNCSFLSEIIEQISKSNINVNYQII